MSQGNERDGASAPQSKTAISSTLAGNHYLVPVRIDAHCQMSWFVRSIERRPQNFATRRGQSVARCEQVIHLEIESRPGTLTLSAAMNCEDASGDHQFRHHFRLMGHFGTKDLTIKCDRSREVFGPDDILEFFDTHTSRLPGTGLQATLRSLPFCLSSLTNPDV